MELLLKYQSLISKMLVLPMYFQDLLLITVIKDWANKKWNTTLRIRYRDEKFCPTKIWSKFFF